MCCDAIATVLSRPHPPSTSVQFDDGDYRGHVTDDWDQIGEHTHHAVSSSLRQCWRQRTTCEV